MMMFFRRHGDKAAADLDAARMIKNLGAQAFAAAGDMSWREDAGLLASPSPGHWHRVQQEIGRRTARPPSREPQVRGFDPARPIGDHSVI